MENTLKPYLSYKEVDLPWLKKVPKHWGVKRNKSIFSEKIVRSLKGDEELLSLSQYTGVSVKRHKNIVGKGLLTNAKSLEGYKIVSVNDLVMNIMLAWNGSLGVSRYTGIISPAYAIFEINKKQNPWYFHYLLRSPQMTEAFRSLSTGVIESRLRLYPDKFFQLYSLVPPLEEQNQIVRYLESKVGKINKLIRVKKKQIELLKDQKQAIINQAVTKGLDPNVPMKQSGVEWLDEMPDNWRMCKLKQIARFRSGTNLTSIQIEENGSFPVYGGNGLRGYYHKFSHDGDYLLVGRQGALCGNVHRVNGAFWATEHAVVVEVADRFSIDWVQYMIIAMDLNQYSQSAAQPGLSVERILNLYTVLPSLKEQTLIANHLDSKLKCINSAIEQIEKKLLLIEEYRTVLISNVVTGQVDVRGIEVEDEDLVVELPDSTELDFEEADSEGEED